MGFLDSPETYGQILKHVDVIVSTAQHEFFGMAVVEAAAAGAVPVIPKRLAYPEVFHSHKSQVYFYDGTVSGLARHLLDFARKLDHDFDYHQRCANARGCALPYAALLRAAAMDDAIARLADRPDGTPDETGR